MLIKHDLILMIKTVHEKVLNQKRKYIYKILKHFIIDKLIVTFFKRDNPN